jgi:hypothetical protein
VRWCSPSVVGGGTTMMLYKVRLPVPDSYPGQTRANAPGPCLP